MSELLLDAAGRHRSPATLPEFHDGRPPRNKGLRYPADPPTIEEIVTVMRRVVHRERIGCWGGWGPLLYLDAIGAACILGAGRAREAVESGERLGVAAGGGQAATVAHGPA
jgi:hypothetical protein